MHKMGLVFGTLDFIVNENDEYIFLEVNEQGQFLWIEDLNPDLKMLDVFIHFLVDASKPYKWDPKNTQHTLEKYEQQMVNMMKENMQHHVALNNVKTYNT